MSHHIEAEEYSRLQTWLAFETYALNTNYLNGGNCRSWAIMYDHIVRLCNTYVIKSSDCFIVSE